MKTKVFDLELLKAGTKINGPAIILNKTSTILVEPSWLSEIDSFGNVMIEQLDFIKQSYSDFKQIKDVPLNPIELSIFGHRFMSIAE